MSIERFNPGGLVAIPGMSQVVAASGGRTIYLSGATASSGSGEVIGDDDVAAQARAALDNIEVALAAAGASLPDLVKLTYYIVDYREELGARLWPVISLPEVAPAVTVVGVGSLARSGLLIEIDAIAVVGSGN